MRMRSTRLAVGLLAAGTIVVLAVGSGLAGAVGGGQKSAKVSRGNALGVTVVRFSKGTTRAQMNAAVEASGGSVVSDLSKIGAVGVDSGSQGAPAFLARVKGQN